MLVPENPYHLAIGLSPETWGKDTPKLRTSTTTLVRDKFFTATAGIFTQAATRLSETVIYW
ncbi:MAG: hypothetical protein K0Q78_869 [Cellvibrio sp.]|jgi:hypothetical protein|nr:hypothetical protein [Cellvibrio sp.]